MKYVKRIGWLLSLALLLTLFGAQTTLAQDGVIGSWEARYWKPVTMAGENAVVRRETSINDTWGLG